MLLVSAVVYIVHCELLLVYLAQCVCVSKNVILSAAVDALQAS